MAPIPRYSFDDLARRWGMSPNEVAQFAAQAEARLKVCIAADAPGIIARQYPDGIRQNPAWLTGNFLILPDEIAQIATGGYRPTIARRPDPEPAMAYGDPHRPPIVGMRFEPPLEVALTDLFVSAADLDRYERVETAH